MSEHWPAVRLGEVIAPSDSAISSSTLGDINLAGVYSFGRGLFRRGPMRPSETSYKTYNRLVVDDFVISQPKAWEGAIARVTPEFEGWFLSPVFPTFRPNRAKLEPQYLEWFCKRSIIWSELQRNSRGIGARRESVSPDTFLALEIPLPSLEEQRRIVARIEEIATQTQEARALRLQSASEAAVLYPRARDKAFRQLKCQREPIGEVIDLINGRAFKPHEWHDEGRQIIRIQNLKYPDAPFNRFSGAVDSRHLVHAGDVLFAWSGQIVSLGAHIWRGGEAILNQHIFNVRGRIEFLPEFLKEGLNALVDEMKDKVRGLEMFHIRKKELDELRFPIPPIAEQRRIVAELGKLQGEADALGVLQSETATELDALMPSILDRAFAGRL